MARQSAIRDEELRPMRRVEYDQLVALGSYADERVELLRGQVLRMSPQSSRHAGVVRRLARWLFAGIGDRGIIQVQGPIAASDDSEPEPDLAVLPVSADRLDALPERARWVIEVAESSLRRDRVIKGGIFAAMGVPEYWVVDVRGDAVDVFTDPGPEGYRAHRRVLSGEVLAPAVFPDLVVDLATLFA